MGSLHRKSFAVVAPFVGAALIAGAVCAQTAAPPAAAKPHKNATPSALVVVTNSRAVALTELDATPTGTFIPRKIAANIAPGKKASVSVATDKDCVFDLHGVYADGSNTDSESVDLCKDKSVNLVN
ncbi:hypothetical protein [Methylocapsa sp. S129]|uniref:hypothetical protein n=1 Tax=Methylocapsa sp. S129 TaxID=1641869 RepID=UPI00131BEC6C|nr:hypothetical protein [Methylocapsa sp. S129]